MNQKLNISLALAAALSGFLVSRYVIPTPALAQSEPPKQITAQSFILVDENSNIVGTFKPSPKSDQPPTVVLLDRTGREIWRADNSLDTLIQRREDVERKILNAMIDK